MTASGSITMATLPAVLADGVMAARIAHGLAWPPSAGRDRREGWSRCRCYVWRP